MKTIMTNNDKATARPWRYNSKNYSIESCVDLNAYGNPVSVCDMGMFFAIDKKNNAELIIKSVNEYEALNRVAECAYKVMCIQSMSEQDKSNNALLSALSDLDIIRNK